MSDGPPGRRDPLWPGLRPGALLLLASLPAALDPGAVARGATLFPLAQDPGYFHPAHAVLLYLWFPIVSLSSMALLLSPGLLVAGLLGRARSLGEWLLQGLAWSIPLLVILGAAGSRGRMFGIEVLILSMVLSGGLAWRQRRGGVPAPWADAGARPTLWAVGLTALLLLALLAPKFLWETFNGDGAHAFESCRLLLYHPVPFWSQSAGEVAAFPGMNSVLFALPGSSFVRLLGEVEAAVRIPAVLYAGLLYAGLLSLIEAGRVSRLVWRERLLAGLPVVAFFFAMAYSATYDPYTADLALPQAQDTLLMVSFVGFLLSFMRQSPAGTLIFGVMTHLSSANGILLLGFWLAGVTLFWRPRPWRMLGWVMAALVTCVALGVVVPPFLAALDLPAPGREHTVGSLLRHFVWLQVTDWRRLLFVAIPCGLVPLIGLVRFRQQDGPSRALTAVVVMQFGFFYLQAFTSLHYYVPAMILPVAVFWRQPWVSEPGQATLWRRLSLAGGLLALVLSFPTVWHPVTAARQAAAGLAVRYPGYAKSEPTIFHASELLGTVYPLDYHAEVPAVYGGSPLAWLHYASTSDTTSRTPVYVLQERQASPPPGMVLMDTNSVAALYLADSTRWFQDRALHPPTPAGSPVYDIPRAMFFGSVPPVGGPRRFFVPGLLSRLGIDVQALRRRLEGHD